MPRKAKYRVANTASRRQAQSELDDLYRSLGFDPTKKPKVKKKGVWRPDAPAQPRGEILDRVPGNGTLRTLEMDVQAGLEDPATLQRKLDVQKSVVQLYPKGGYGPVSDKDHLKTNMRRNPI